MKKAFESSRLLAAIAAVALMAGTAPAQTGTSDGEWRYWGGDAGTTHYAPLDQIDRTNVDQLEIAWRWKSENFGPRADFNWEATPLMIGGVLYFTAGSSRAAVAVDATTGETLWTYRLEEGERGARSPRANNRGLSYWNDGDDERIFLITRGYRLVALDAKTGDPISGFGDAGMVDLYLGLDRDQVEFGRITSTSPAMIVGDIAVIGAALQGGSTPDTLGNVPGYVRGYDVRTGELVWTFHTIPQAGEPGNETWEDESWQYTGNAAVWAPMSADLERGYIYLPIEAPTADYYGGHRLGDNLFSSSLVCLDARTGAMVWHYQLVHHDIFDYDTASAPLLLDVTVDGEPVPAVAQVTKQAFTYVFNRVTGEPVWPIEERPVPQSDVPGERSSATQPFPTRPAPFDQQGISDDDLLDFTPEILAEARRIAEGFRLGPLYTPPIVAGTGGKAATLQIPHAQGGANWQGAAADPETGIMYVPSVTNWFANALQPGGDRSEMNYIAQGTRIDRPLGLPLVKPPWGRITAIDLNTGDHVWMVPNGQAPDYVREHEALQGIDLSGAGNPERAPLLVTRTLLFSGDGAGLFASGPGGGGPLFRALDKATGETLFQMELPANETGLPMTYMVDGRQYIVVAIGARNFPAELVALTLPD
jgi:quinoprotein glucose dehydrogenase